MKFIAKVNLDAILLVFLVRFINNSSDSLKQHT